MKEYPHAESIHHARLNFEIAICHKDFSRADKIAEDLACLYLNELCYYSEKVQEGEEEARKKYTEVNNEWIDVQTIRELYSK
jgi:hypothetical protein